MIGSIVAILATILPVFANGKAVADNRFSVTSVIQRDDAFYGTHDIELSGNLTNLKSNSQ